MSRNKKKANKPTKTAEQKRIRSLKTTIWRLCKEITRARYPNVCYTCKKENLEPKQCHTGHFLKEKGLPLQLKYDLRILRIQCPTCNLFLDGNEGRYAIQLTRDHGPSYIVDFYDEVLLLQNETLDQEQQIKFLETTIEKYKQILGK